MQKISIFFVYYENYLLCIQINTFIVTVLDYYLCQNSVPTAGHHYNTRMLQSVPTAVRGLRWPLRNGRTSGILFLQSYSVFFFLAGASGAMERPCPERSF